MDKSVERELTELEAIVDTLPDYLTRSELYTNVPGKSTPVSIGIAQDRLKKLQQRGDLPRDAQVQLAGIEGRLRAVERLYPTEFRRKLESEQRSRVNVARWQAEEKED